VSRPSSYVAPGDLDLINARIKMGIYSHPGEGKTVLWGSGGTDVLFINSDPEGTISATAQGHRYHSVDAFDWDDMDQVYDWLKGDKPDDFRWIVWDSLTLFQDEALIDDVMVDAAAENPKQEEFVPSKREYLINMNKLGRMVRQLAKLDYNLGISFHVMTTTESGGDGTIFMPQVQGKNMPSKIAGYMNVIGYMDKRRIKEGDKERMVQSILFRREGRYYAKDRWNALGQRVDRPTLPKIEGLIEEQRARMIAANEGAKPSSRKPATAEAKPPASAAARARAARARAASST
jgi:hypothetical protein